MGTGADSSPDTTGGALAERLNYLFANMHPPGAPYTNAHVAEEISGGDEYGSVKLTEQYLSMLRNGKRTNPSPDVLRALAKFFAVPVGYLLGDLSDSQAQRVEEEVRFLVAMRDKRVRGIALRSLGLPPEVQDSLATIISQFRQQMNLPPDPPGSPGPADKLPGGSVPGATPPGDASGEGPRGRR